MADRRTIRIVETNTAVERSVLSYWRRFGRKLIKIEFGRKLIKIESLFAVSWASVMMVPRPALAR